MVRTKRTVRRGQQLRGANYILERSLFYYSIRYTKPRLVPCHPRLAPIRAPNCTKFPSDCTFLLHVGTYSAILRIGAGLERVLSGDRRLSLDVP